MSIVLATDNRLGFGTDGTDDNPEQWDARCIVISEALLAAGLPELYDDRWDEYDEGCMIAGDQEFLAKVADVVKSAGGVNIHTWRDA